MLENQTLCSLFLRSVDAGGEQIALRDKDSECSWKDYGERVRRLARGWQTVGVKPHEPVALMMKNAPEFNVVDTSLLHAGAVPFSVAVTDPAERIANLMEVSGSRFIVVDAAAIERAIAVAKTSNFDVSIVIAGENDTYQGLSLETVAAAGANLSQEPWRHVNPEDDATLIFTSGSTGTPKAVKLSHRAIVLSLRNTNRIAPVSSGGHVLSYLPLSHIAERFMSHYLSLAFGVTVTSVPTPGELYDTLRAVEPSRFFSVPRVYEKLVAQIRATAAGNQLLADALARSGRWVRAEQEGKTLTSDEQVQWNSDLETLAPIRVALGLHRTEYRGVATAPSSPDILESMSAVGLPVGNIWGMSEAIMCTMNPPERLKLNTVGVFLDDVEHRVAEDGELLIRGVNLFSGYMGDTQGLAGALDGEGWFHTGDLGSIDSDGYLSIVGRKKEIMITATGKNVAPAAIEAALREASPLVSYAMVVAEGRRYVTALIALDEDAVSEFAIAQGLAGPFSSLIRSPEVVQEVEKTVERVNRTLQKAESVRNWHLPDTPWIPGSDEITPTMKLRRNSIMSSYEDVIDALYA
ncbi:AMP-dependent synthetase/ligase [Arthrobacter sp. UCD-GKA]|uniref:AMP-dependent synthetase/ligase n=1 Tax=Arthrobacter sp. UCD-GKA TaxID=1913576 RepID=UPI0009F2E521|nr:AMP-dependent synthetase/ligase [Arthrobacter sp. UCD-GKA]